MSHTETVRLHVHRRQVHKAPEYAHGSAENDNEPAVVALLLLVDALLLLVEEPDDGIELVVKSLEPHVNINETLVHISEFVLNMTNLGEEGTHDILHVGHC